jgi:hypothetical protein
VIDAGAQQLHFYTVEKISGRRSKTPEGYLLIQGVPLARTGTMIYGPDEVPVPPGPDGLVYIERAPEQVFRVETVASANGKDIVNDHPQDDVSPLNWRELSLGTLMNPRRGSGIEDDFLIGDLLVKSQEGIDLIESGKVELSMGYDSGYMITGPGRGYQMNIIYNHVALVDKGRCGPRCSIGDRQYVQEKNEEKNTMSTHTRRTADRGRSSTAVRRVLDRLLKVAKTGDEEMLEETLGDAEKELTEREEPRFEIHNHNHPSGDAEMTEEEKKEKKTEDAIRRAIGDAMTPVLDAIDKRFRDIEEDLKDGKGKDGRRRSGRDKEPPEDDDETKDEAILGNLELEAPPGTNDRAAIAKARDSAFMVDSFQDTVALAEVLVPGMRVPTFDSALPPAKGYDAICKLRRTTLDLAYAQVDGRHVVDSVTGGRDFKTMDCASLRTVFLAAGNLKKSLNNQTTKTTDAPRPGGAVGGAKLTPRDINEKMRKHYASAAK